MVWRKRRSSSTTSTRPFAIIVPCPPAPLDCITNLFDHSPGQAAGTGLVTAATDIRPLLPRLPVCSWVHAPGPVVVWDGAERREDHDHRGSHAQGALHANLAPVLL